MTERYCVTGCAGFIGSHILRRLLEDGASVVGVDDFSTGRRENLDGLEDRFQLIEGTLCDPDVAAAACKDVDIVLHQASIPSVPRSVADPLASLHSSVTATVTLLEAAHRAGVRRVVQAASSSAYGDTEVRPKTEDMLPSPKSPYAVAKLAQEHYAAAFSDCYGLETASLRYFNVFGPRQDPTSDYAAVIPKFITLMLAGTPPRVDGDGLQTRDFTYVANIVEGNLAAARAGGELKGEVFNIACGDEISILDLVGTLNNLLGTSIDPMHGPPRTGDVRHSRADIARASERLDFRPVATFEEGLRRTIEFYRDA